MIKRFKFWFYFKEDVKLAKNADPDKYVYNNYSIGFDSCSDFSLPDGSVGKNIIIFGVGMSSSVHIHNKKKDIWILDKRSTQGLDDTSLTAESQYSINFSKSNREFCLNLNYNGGNRFLFVNTKQIYQFKAKENINSKHFSLGNI